MRLLRFMVAWVALVVSFPVVATDLRGHGGPVRAIVITGGHAATASFDSTIIRWDLARGTALQVLRFHDGAVNALVALPDGGIASAGEDRRIALWPREGTAPRRVLEGHEGPIAALALSPDGTLLASASWDGTLRLWPLAGGAARSVEGHRGPVNAVAFLPDGRLVSAGYDGVLRIFAQDGAPRLVELGLPLNAIRMTGGEIAVAGADGALRFVSPDGDRIEKLDLSEFPLVALAVSADGAHLAAAGFRGALVMVDRSARRITRRLEGPAFPLWSLVFSPDGEEILTGGADRLVRRWKVATGEPVNPGVVEATEARVEAFAHHPGAEIFRACIACHTLGAEDGNRAGPSLHRLMGRRIATAPGYAYSPALAGLDIVWSRETVSKLFEIGPMAYTPGTKMPEQVITSAADREALVDFLEQATR
jgi:cytochrome c